MLKNPKVSIIISSYNHAKYLRAAIDSALNQTFTNFELIIWDDASTDDSWEIIQSYTDPRIQSFLNKQNRRAASNFNDAIANVARGEYIALFTSDDIWEPDKLEKQVDFLDGHPNIGVVFSLAQVIDEKGNIFEDSDHFYSTIFDQDNRSRFDWLNRFFMHGNALCDPSAVVRKICYKECGLYRNGLTMVDDLDFWIRVCLKFEIHVIQERLIKFRVRDNEANLKRKPSGIQDCHAI